MLVVHECASAVAAADARPRGTEDAVSAGSMPEPGEYSSLNVGVVAHGDIHAEELAGMDKRVGGTPGGR